MSWIFRTASLSKTHFIQLGRTASAGIILGIISTPIVSQIASAGGGTGGSGVFTNGGNGGDTGQPGVTVGPNAGGVGGASPGGNGGNGVSARTGASGGGGGASGTAASPLGGNGGNGGNGLAGSQSVGGGGGGAGGNGITNLLTNFTNGGAVQAGKGGDGGAGGAGGPAPIQVGAGGAGGDGGSGISASGVTITNNGVIAGGNGGRGGLGSDGVRAANGVGGSGISGSNLNVVNTDGSVIRGGLAADGVTRANAVTFTGGVNTFTLTSTSIQQGKVIAFSSADTLVLSGNGSNVFDLSNIGALNTAAQFQRFGILQKSGGGSFTLTNSPSGLALAYFVQAGTLDLSGTTHTLSSLKVTGGTLQNGVVTTTGAFDMQAGTVSAALAGTGVLIKTTAGTVALTGNNIYTGATNVNGGTLQVDGAITASNIIVNNGGTLSGVGKIGDPTINAGGTLSPGNANSPLGTLTISGQPLVFQPGSFFAVTIAPNGNSKVVLTAGAVATINGGTIQATFQPGSYIAKQYTLLSGGMVTGTFAGLTNTNLPAGFTSSLAYTPSSVLLDLKASLGLIAGSNPNEAAIANALNAAFNNGGQLPAAFTNLFGLTGTALSDALNQLSPQIFSQARVGALLASQQFTGDLMSCRAPGADTGAVIREGQCLWARNRESVSSGGTTATDLGLRDRTNAFAAGAQVALGQGWNLGTAIGYDQVSLNGATTNGTGDRVHAGLALKYTTGPLQLAGTLTGSWGSLETRRGILVGGLAGTMAGRSDVDTYAAHARAAYLIDFSSWYLKPLVDVRLTRLDFSGLTETGGPAALQVSSARDTVISTSPALEIGSNFALDMTTSFRPFARAGVTWGDTGSLALDAQFVAAPQVFTTTTAMDRVTADVAAGFDLVGKSGAALRLEYDGRFGGNTTSASFMAKGALRF